MIISLGNCKQLIFSMLGESGLMDHLVIESSELQTEEDSLLNKNEDNGPCPKMTARTAARSSSEKAFGFVDQAKRSLELSEEDKFIQRQLSKSMKQSKHKKKLHITWPARSPIPINEFGSTRIFARAYPWLFPGGFGDVKDFPGDCRCWGEHLLLYKDGRFAKDKFFNFFATDYITRHRNASSGNWFIKDFNEGGPETLDELKKAIEEGDSRFVSRLTYFSKNVKGSSPFWFQKRSEL